MNVIRKMQGSAYPVYNVDTQKNLNLNLLYLNTIVENLGNNVLINNLTTKKIVVTNLFITALEHNYNHYLIAKLKSDTIDFYSFYIYEKYFNISVFFTKDLEPKTLNGEDLILNLNYATNLGISLQYYYED